MKNYIFYYRMQPNTRDAFLEDILNNQIESLTRQENGCIQFDFLVPATDPDTLVLIEKWESEAAMAAHHETEHFGVLRTLKEGRVISVDKEEY